MPKPSRIRCVLICAALAVACATGQPASRSDTSILTRTDIEQGGSSIFTAREAVRILRPQWLARPMGRVASSNVITSGGGNQDIIVYIDDIRQPEFESLATVPAAKIVRIKYLDQNSAVLLHGPGHEGGVIEVTTSDKRK
jgi:Outer membrane cobalamin receptor protein